MNLPLLAIPPLNALMISIFRPIKTLLGLETTKIPRPIPQIIIISPAWTSEIGFPPETTKPPIHETKTITIPTASNMIFR